MSGPTSRAVPLSQIVSTGPMTSGEALAVVREVGRRAHSLKGTGLDFALDAIRIDEMGGVRCRPCSTVSDPVPSLARLLEQLVSGADVPAEDIAMLVFQAISTPPMDLATFLLELSTRIDDKSHEGGLRTLAVRTHANNTGPPSGDPPSVTELYPYPPTGPAAETWYQRLPHQTPGGSASTTPSSEPSPTLVVPLDMESDVLPLPRVSESPSSRTNPTDERKKPRPPTPTEESPDEEPSRLATLIGVGVAAAIIGAGIAGGMWLFTAGG